MAVDTERLHIGPRDHVVQFYGHDAELIEGAGDYLRAAVADDRVAIVIATPGHRGLFSRWLAEAGIDVASARSGGRYLDLDAEETIDRIMVDGRPDPARFDEVIGGLVRAAALSGRPVRAFGEMVAVLWNSGLVNAALELESLWNELARQYQFSVFCAYPAAEDKHFDALHSICLLHEKVLDDGFAFEAREFALTTEAPAAARHFAVAALRRLSGSGALAASGAVAGCGALAEDVAIVATELAANAALHARTGFTVALSCHQGVVRVSVRDSGPTPSLSAEPMHGLGVVDALARNWGVLSFGDQGKAVWAELVSPPVDLSPRPRRDASRRAGAFRAAPSGALLGARAAPSGRRGLRAVGVRPERRSREPA